MRSAQYFSLACLGVLVGACSSPSEPEPRPEPPLIVEAPQPSLAAPHPTPPPPPPAMPERPKDSTPPLLPLARLLAIAQRDTPGEILEVERDDDDGLKIYEVQILTPDDRKIEIKLNAVTGAIIEKDED